MESVMMPGWVRPADSSVLRLAATAARDNFAQTVNGVASGDNHVILSQDGKDVAAIIHIEEFWLLERSIEQLEDEMDLEAIRAAREETASIPAIKLAELKKELGL
ncbi:MAG: type II toxin-antitoxin system prevent-host-death family antitoxin [Hormoscilla sp. GUM202]|nr:type II toxin-antitoxin system prevent-host-death family antitoxin [Hormoscilla sp. GUM202]